MAMLNNQSVTVIYDIYIYTYGIPPALKTCMHVLKAATYNLHKTMQNIGFWGG